MEKNSIKAFQEFSEERFTKRIIYKKGDTTAFVLNFFSGQQLPSHKHPGTEVYLYVVTGCGTIIVNGQKQRFQKGISSMLAAKKRWRLIIAEVKQLAYMSF